MKTNFIDNTIKSTIVLSCALSCVVVRSRAQFLAGGGGDICGENCRIKIASKNRNCGDAKFFFYFFVVKNKGQTQKASGPKVAGRQHVGVEKYTR